MCLSMRDLMVFLLHVLLVPSFQAPCDKFALVSTMILFMLRLSLLNAQVFGSEFSVALLGLDDPAAEYKFIFTNPESTAADVVIADYNHDATPLTVPGDGILEHPLTSEYALNGSDKSNKTIHVSSTGPVRLQVFSTSNGHTEGFLAIPKDELVGPNMVSGVYEYFTTTFCAIGGYCQFAVSAFDEGALIKLEFPPGSEEVVFCRGVGYYRSHRDPKIEIDRNHTVHFESASDLTGVRIYSYYPIAVFVGSRNISDGTAVTHMVEQLHPTANWGKEYVVRTLGNNGYGDILRFSSQLPNTTVDIQGFPKFVISSPYHCIWRRFDKGMEGFIRASHRIQIVQITGLAYASASDVMAASMTVVPAIENGAKEFAVSCGASGSGTFNVVSKYQDKDETKVSGVSYDTEWLIDGEDYVTGNISATGGNRYVVSNANSSINGIVTCDSTATMPLGLVHSNDTLVTPVSPPPAASLNMCTESFVGQTTFDTAMESPPRSSVHIGEHKIFILRVRTCGHFVLQSTGIDDIILVTITRGKMYARKCPSGACTAAMVDLDISSYYGNGYICDVDFAIFWFRFSANDLEFGPGPFPNRATVTTAPSMMETLTGISANVTDVLMFAAPGQAEFYIDFEHEDDCDFYDSKWRCQDKTQCESYGQRVCTDNPDFAQENCAKYCKLCTPDSYGRKFLVLSPKTIGGVDKTCKLVVTGYSALPKTAVGSSVKLLSVENTEGTSKIYSYPCGEMVNAAVVVYSDIDVTVTVVYDMKSTITGIYNTVRSGAYMVYPVDTFGNEYMTFPIKGSTACVIGTEYTSMGITRYDNNARESNDIGYLDLHTFADFGPAIRHIKGNKPFVMVCGDDNARSTHQQMVPISTWGTKYVVPKFEDNPSDLPFDLSLNIVASRKNTAVYIDGDFNAVHIIDEQGNTVNGDQIITGAETYTVTSNNPIGVAVVFTDQTNPVLSALIQLPPNTTFHSHNLLVAPSAMLEGLTGFGAPASSITKYAVTASGVSAKSTLTDVSKDIVTKYEAAPAGEYFISAATEGTGKWIVYSGPRMFSNYDSDSAELCYTSNVTVGDTLDNDCDGLVNEDTCFSGYGVYGEDYDLDGCFNDDCCCEDTTESVVGKPTDPVCLEILKPANQCWAICTCNCAWLNNLEVYNQMTEAEKETLHSAVAAQQKAQLSVDQSTLSATTAQKESAADDRQSAVGIGYLGIALFTIVFGMIFIMDITSLIRDARILGGNLREGCTRLLNCIRRNPTP